MRQPRPPPHVTLHAGAVDGRAVGKPQLTLSANRTSADRKPQLTLVANKTITKIIHSRTESAIIDGSQFIPNQDPRDVSQVPIQLIGFAL
jgi:hypothetical protein